MKRHWLCFVQLVYGTLGNVGEESEEYYLEAAAQLRRIDPGALLDLEDALTAKVNRLLQQGVEAIPANGFITIDHRARVAKKPEELKGKRRVYFTEEASMRLYWNSLLPQAPESPSRYEEEEEPRYEDEVIVHEEVLEASPSQYIPAPHEDLHSYAPEEPA